MRYKTHLAKSFINECKSRLLEAKADILNRLNQSRELFLAEDRHSGDSADQCSRLLEENGHVTFHNQWRRQLLEIEHALSKIELGKYGVCEETEEPIEPSRLRSIPWTRYSIEGAEMHSPSRH